MAPSCSRRRSSTVRRIASPRRRCRMTPSSRQARRAPNLKLGGTGYRARVSAALRCEREGVGGRWLPGRLLWIWTRLTGGMGAGAKRRRTGVTAQGRAGKA